MEKFSFFSKLFILLTFMDVFLIAKNALSDEDNQKSSRPSPNLITQRDLELTSYQQAGNYDPRFDVKADVVMVYGVSDDVIESIPEWRAKSGSKIAIMTGIAWGGYGEYLDGRFDGINHWDDAQVRADNSLMLHDPTTPYLSPSISFTHYLAARLRKLVDSGIDAIYLEEPEFWAFTGFGDSFKREWKIFYNEDWIRPDSSFDAQYRASKLKKFLYARALDRVAAELKEYSLKKYNRVLKVYVATHSLLSYAQIQMISPESSLFDLPSIDGIIVQTWTGTARFGNFYNGIFKERTFEIGLLEYGVMQEMARESGKRVYFLNDPVEDNPSYDWDDYKTHYLCTLVSSLLRSDSYYYEVAPWPSRVFLGAYPAGSPNATNIPADYATTLSLVFQQLRDMNQLDVEWLDESQVNSPLSTKVAHGATEGVGVLLADSSMFQRAEPTSKGCCADDPSDPTLPTVNELGSLADFTGLTLPLIKRGIPIDVPVLDNISRYPGYLSPYKVLVLSYDFQKPSTPGVHAVIADWVSRGGSLVFVDSRRDAYNSAKDWWNSSGQTYATPGDHLMTSFGLSPDQEPGKYPFGKGFVYVERKRPSYYSRSPQNADEYRRIIADAAAEVGVPFIERNYFLKRRGPYLLAAVMAESSSDAPLVLNGTFVNLFDPKLQIQKTATIRCEERAWFLDLSRATIDAPAVLASSCRIENLVHNSDSSVTIEMTSPADITAVSLIKLLKIPSEILVNGNSPEETRWDEETKTLFFKFQSSGKASVKIR